jgi:predicted transcriptional regulator
MGERKNSLIDSLQKMDLNYEEAQIYYTLLKYGKKGTIIRKLREELPIIERTTLYSILKRLIEKGCIKEGSSSVNYKKLKNFIASEPTEYFNKFFLKKKQEFEELQDIKTKTLKGLQNLYEKGLEITDEELDPFIIPYIHSLLNKGWIIQTQKINKGINMFGSNLYYEYHILPPKELEKKITRLGIIISLYNTEEENDEITLKFVLKQFKKIITEFHQGDFNNFNILESKIELLGKKFPSLLIKATEKKSNIYLEFGTTLIISIKNKIFFIWEELIHDKDTLNKLEQQWLLEGITKSIFEVEEVTF